MTITRFGNVQSTIPSTEIIYQSEPTNNLKLVNVINTIAEVSTEFKGVLIANGQTIQGNVDLETKTQNINLADTTADTTLFDSNVVISSPTIARDITAFDGQGPDLAIDGTSPGQLFVFTGFEFTAQSNLSNVRFKIKSSQRSTTDTSNRFIYVYEYNTTTNSFGNSFAGLSIGTYGNALLPPIIEGDYNLTYPYQLSLLAGKRYAILLPVVAGDKISEIGPSPITVDSNISVIGSVRLDAAGNFPASTNDGYAPILTLGYDVLGLFDKRIDCGIIDNKNGTIINVSDPVDLQDVSTKNYVDTAIAAIPVTDLSNLEMKTQNISLADTVKTLFNKGDIKLGENLLGINKLDSYTRPYSSTQITPLGSTTGISFEIPTAVRIDDIYVRVLDWVTTDETLSVVIWRMDIDASDNTGNTSLIVKDINKNNNVQGFYFTKVLGEFNENNILPAGKYKIGFPTINGNLVEDNSVTPIVPNPFFTSFQPQYYSGIGIGTNLPDTDSVSFIGGFNFSILPQFDGIGQLSIRDNAVINHCSLGKYFNDDIIKDDMTGVGLVGDPILFPNVSYIQNVGLILGGGVSPQIGTIFYNIWDIWEGPGRILSTDLVLSLEWALDGAIFSVSFDKYKLSYTHNPTTFSSEFTLTENNVPIDTQFGEIFHEPGGSTFEKITISLDLTNSQRKVTATHNGNLLYLYQDNIEDIPTAVGVAIGGGSATANRIIIIKNIDIRYEQTAGVLIIDPEEVNVNSDLNCNKSVLITNNLNSLDFNTEWKVKDDSVNNNRLTAEHYDGAGIMDKQVVLANKPETETENTIYKDEKYSGLNVDSMRSSLTVSGGTNKGWGNFMTLTAGEDLLAGRVVGIRFELVGSDTTESLKLVYLEAGTNTDASIYPVGITQHDALNGAEIKILTKGFTSMIFAIAEANPNRGCLISYHNFSNVGKAKVGGGNNIAILGYLAQSNAIATDGAALVYFDGYFHHN